MFMSAAQVPVLISDKKPDDVIKDMNLSETCRQTGEHSPDAPPYIYCVDEKHAQADARKILSSIADAFNKRGGYARLPYVSDVNDYPLMLSQIERQGYDLEQFQP